ncbi:hypothetical protein EX30DRAFT_339775 [Ascodesmis nigricans]|uniref:Uncharacterized protein n=1 Tax=Ascodesmis nigricans TaxID=341454 RepID=A0A4S2N082_9PEZI|nr:hypothetical protein EX30DRAFT_339775 [Ascodesmis nigricans]
MLKLPRLVNSPSHQSPSQFPSPSLPSPTNLDSLTVCVTFNLTPPIQSIPTVPRWLMLILLLMLLLTVDAYRPTHAYFTLHHRTSYTLSHVVLGVITMATHRGIAALRLCGVALRRCMWDRPVIGYV